MAKPSHLLGLGATVLGLVAAPSMASAQSMNPALSRFVVDHRCHAFGAGNGSFADYKRLQPAVGVYNDNFDDRRAYSLATGRDSSCAPDHVLFKRLINQWGYAFAPAGMHSARTTGFGGFHFALEGAYTKIDDTAEYWQLGTQGARDPSSNKASIINNGPPGILSVYSAKVRKSFGFGLELGTQVGFMPDTTILSGGADARLSLLEGFRTGFLGILPDVAAGAGVRTITGTPEFQMTVVGLDAQVSKPLALASQSVLTPWVGFQYLWIFGDSGLIDTTPATDPVAYCQATGTNAPGNLDPDPQSTAYDGQPVCAEPGSPLDFNNNIVFNNARLERQRMMFGLNYRYEMVSVGGEFIFDVVSPADAQSGGKDTVSIMRDGRTTDVSDEEALKDVPRQWTLVLEIGAAF